MKHNRFLLAAFAAAALISAPTTTSAAGLAAASGLRQGAPASHGTKYRPWVAALLTRRPTKVAAIALANKLARMAWAMMARGERYNYPASLRV